MAHGSLVITLFSDCCHEIGRKTNNFRVQHVVYCCCHTKHNNWFLNLLFLNGSHVDLYL